MHTGLGVYVQDTRLEDYRNYLNLKDEVDAHQEQLTQECLSVQKVSLSDWQLPRMCAKQRCYSHQLIRTEQFHDEP